MSGTPDRALEGCAGGCVTLLDIGQLDGLDFESTVVRLGSGPAGHDCQGHVAGVSFAVLEGSHFEELHFGGAGGAYDASGTGVDQ